MESRLPPKIAVVASRRARFGAPSPAAGVFGTATNVRYVDAGSRLVTCAIGRRGIGARLDDVDLIHLLDAHLAPIGHRLRRRYGVPVTATVSVADLACGRGLDPSLREIDGLFADADCVSQVRSMVGGVCVTPLPLCAQALPTPSERAERSVQRALRRVEAGRFVLALPAPTHAGQLEWFCDEVLTQLPFAPICLVVGGLRSKPRGSEGRPLNVGQLRVMRAKVDVDTIAAVARSVDAFVEPWCASVEQGIDARRLLLMASSGVPVIVADGAPGGSVIEHERNGFVVDDGSAAQWARMLSDVFALPPLQRQFLGEEFTRNTFESAPLSAVKAAYYVRFDELLGRYSIPAELRAA